MEDLEQRSNRKWKKLLLLILFAIGLLVLSAYLLVHSYISKINNSSSLKANTQAAETQVMDLPEDTDSTEPDSPVSDIENAENEIRKNMEANSTTILSDKNVFNLLLIGTDARAKGENSRSDAMILVSINKKKKTITATSLLRDIYLQIPGKNNNRLNAACAFGGPELLMDTIEQNFKVAVDRYVSVDFYVFMDIVDAVGGVTINVTKEEIPIINDYIAELNRLQGEANGVDYLTSSGELKLNGKQALGYARNRYIGTDFERTARQRRVLEQAFNKVKKLNLLELNKLLNKLLPEITTDLSEGDIFSLILSLPKYAGYELNQWSIPVDNSYQFMRIRGMEVITLDFNRNIEALRAKIYDETAPVTQAYAPKE